MRRLSIARSLRLVLVGLTIVLAIVAVSGVASLSTARQRYADRLAASSELATAVANLSSAGVIEVEVVRDASGVGALGARRRSSAALSRSSQTATSLARSDQISERLVTRQIALEQDAVRLAGDGRLNASDTASGPLAQAGVVSDQLQDRQQARETDARREDRDRSRETVELVIASGTLALLAALGLIAALVKSIRRPLDELVEATRDLAAGQLQRRVQPTGPRELRDLSLAFNAMGEDLADAQRRIEDERRRLAVTIESLGDGLLVTDASSSSITTVNPRAADLIPELGPGGHTDQPGSPLPNLPAALAGEVVIEHRGRMLAVTAARLGGVGGGVAWTVRDTTERARLERAKSDFVATASHELRSPLTSIKGFVELLGRGPEPLSDRQREFVEIILRSTDRLVELVSDLLDVARIEADQVEIDLRPIDIGDAVRDVADLIGPRIAAKRQRLGVYVAPTLPLALADPGRIRQVVGNLLTNAHLYTPEDGRIHIGVEADRARVRIVVADSGVGMSAEETNRVFERFYRAPRDSASTPGTGLGLSIVRSLVDLHHGEIEIESEPGRGTTFHVLIPAAVVPSDPGYSLGVVRGRKVLVIDDEPQVASLIASQLAAIQVEPKIAHGGRAALYALRNETFDAVTLDVLMPDMNGLEVLRVIREDPELRRLPIVIVSVVSGHKDLSGEWAVTKPIRSDELLNVLAAAIRAGRSRVLIVGREHLQPTLEPALDELGIEHQWETTGAAAARVCSERRFEVALIDVGIRNPQAALEALDLRGRRLRRAVILFSDAESQTPAGIVKLGMEVVPVQDAAQALLDALRGTRQQVDTVLDGASDRS